MAVKNDPRRDERQLENRKIWQHRVMNYQSVDQLTNESIPRPPTTASPLMAPLKKYYGIIISSFGFSRGDWRQITAAS